MIETPRGDLTIFKVHFGLLTLKAYTKGKHGLRFEAVVHNTRQLRCSRSWNPSPGSPELSPDGGAHPGGGDDTALPSAR